MFPQWKKASIVPAYKKGDKQLINNYWPVSLLPKFLRKLCISLFEFVDTNKLINNNQSGFRPGDFCKHQLLSITHEIYKAFHANPSLVVRVVFLDLSKAFNRVWHEDLMYKLKCLGVRGKYYGLIQSFLSDRFQGVVLNWQSSDWWHIKAGVPLGSKLGPLFFLVYINDLPEGITSVAKLLQVDTSLFSVVHDPKMTSLSLNEDLLKINKWAYQWERFNPDTSKQTNAPYR